jgi:hypothetical protein
METVMMGTGKKDCCCVLVRFALTYHRCHPKVVLSPKKCLQPGGGVAAAVVAAAKISPHRLFVRQVLQMLWQLGFG